MIVNKDVLDILSFIDFNCNSFTGMSIFIPNRPSILKSYLGTDYMYIVFHASIKGVQGVKLKL